MGLQCFLYIIMSTMKMVTEISKTKLMQFDDSIEQLEPQYSISTMKDPKLLLVL